MKKGFTLIELLAVIIILAIVALIATPIVLDVIEDARKSAAKSQTGLILDSAKLYYTERYFKTESNFEGYECSIVNKVGCIELSLEGDQPDQAVLTISKQGKVNGKVVVGKYTYYICDNKISETEDCKVLDYTEIYEITEEGTITSIKDSEYVKDGEVTVPEFIGEVEVSKISTYAFKDLEITKVTILSNKPITIEANAIPETVTKLVVKSCYASSYTEYTDILETIETECETTGIYTDVILNGADPELDETMIPIVINDDGTLTKADLRTEWYNYLEKEWANVVLVSDEKREEYKTATAGTTIEAKYVKAYYVWVPRYKYQIFTDVTNLETVGSITDSSEYTNKADIINVVFEDNTTEKSNGTGKGEWLTHPAFTFGNEELNGIWVGKFETTGTTDAPTVLAYDSRYTETTGIQSLRSQNVSTQFLTSQKINYGLSNLEASMLKNMEWGAVAYLTASVYGQGKTEVMINNSSSYYTGCAATVAPTTTYGGYTSQTGGSEGYYAGCENEWYTQAGQKASTTGTIYGIYDMSGGAWEYVMGVMEDEEGSGVPASGRNNDYNSGFTGILTYPNDGSDSSITSIIGEPFPDNKYYDIYAYNTSMIVYADRGHLGDATYELDGFTNWKDPDGYTRYHSGWNQDYAHFVYNVSPWFLRGGYWDAGASAGVFAFTNGYGYAYGPYSFRSVLR